MGGVLGAPTAMSTACEYNVAVPLYLWPGYGSQPCAWERLLSSPDRNPLVVVNPDSGPGSEPVDLFKKAVLKCQAAGIKVIGYVRTIYAERPLADVLKDMQLYQTWYGVDGWFADEMFHWGEGIEFGVHDYSLYVIVTVPVKNRVLCRRFTGRILCANKICSSEAPRCKTHCGVESWLRILA